MRGLRLRVWGSGCKGWGLEKALRFEDWRASDFESLHPKPLKWGGVPKLGVPCWGPYFKGILLVIWGSTGTVLRGVSFEDSGFGLRAFGL